VLDAVIDHLTLEASIGGSAAAATASDRLEAVYVSIARLLNASADEIALVENATRGWDMAVYAIPFAPGDRVLTTQSEYASNLVALLQIARHRGVMTHASHILNKLGLATRAELIAFARMEQAPCSRSGTGACA